MSMDALPRIHSFLEDLSGERGWDSPMRDRLQVVAEETLLMLCGDDESEPSDHGRRLILSASSDGPAVDLEFVSATGDAANLEDRMALLTKHGMEAEGLDPGDVESAIGRDASLRLLRHYAVSINHR